MMAEWLIALLLAGNISPLLTVPIVHAQDKKDVWMSALSDCESNASTTIKVWDVNNQWSYGKYQWQMRSWLRYKKQGATKENILNEKMQDKITRYVLDTYGDQDWINCSRLVRKSLGSYPSS